MGNQILHQEFYNDDWKIRGYFKYYSYIMAQIPVIEDKKDDFGLFNYADDCYGLYTSGKCIYCEPDSDCPVIFKGMITNPQNIYVCFVVPHIWSHKYERLWDCELIGLNESKGLILANSRALDKAVSLDIPYKISATYEYTR